MTCDNSSPKPKAPNKSNGNLKNHLMHMLCAAIIFVLVELLALGVVLVAPPSLASKVPASFAAVAALGGYVVSYYGELKQKQACKDVGDFLQLLSLLVAVMLAVWA